jgi:hypothetical protein
MMIDEEESLGLTLNLTSESAAAIRKEQQVGRQRLKPEESSSKDDLPVLSIHLERLVGYQPPEEELGPIQSQLILAMWTRYNEDRQDGQPASASSAPSSQEIPPPDFDQHVAELMGTGIGTFYPNRDQVPNDPKISSLILSYPPSLQNPSTGSMVDTRRLWDDISQRRVPIDFVEQLFQYLQRCNQGIFWKRDMSLELCRIVEEEKTHVEYLEWNAVERQKKLDKLYDVRETLVHQLEMHSEKLKKLEKERDEKVASALRQQRLLHQGSVGGLQGFDMESTILSFPNEFQLLGLSNDRLDENDEHDWGLDDESDNHSSDDASSHLSEDESSHQDDSCDADDGYEANDEGVPTSEANNEDGKEEEPANPTEQVTTDESSNLPGDENETKAKQPTTLSKPFQRRRQRAKQKRRQIRTAAQEAEHQGKLEVARAQEEEVRAKCTTSDLIVAQTIQQALEEKMQKVEELLETLQDEEWEAEEEETEKENGKSDPDSGDGSFSLLDQILAMILGSLPAKPGVSTADHFRFVQREHAAIVKTWQDYFGRLPPAFSSERPSPIPTDDAPTEDNNEDDIDAVDVQLSQKPELKVLSPPKSAIEQRLALGITENDEEDWDAVEDWDDYLEASPDAASGQTPTKEKDSSPPKAKGGLRPGGKARA